MSARILMAVVAVVISGCEFHSGETKPRMPRDVRMVYLIDGTRCAIFEGYYKGGISCDWSHPITPEAQ